MQKITGNNIVIDGKYCWQSCGCVEKCNKCKRLNNGDIDHYENYEVRAEEKNNGWIPCSERLPNREEYLENDGRFILTDGNRRYQGLFDIYHDKFMIMHRRYRQNWSSPAEDKCVIAWQPLPEPYKPTEK